MTGIASVPQVASLRLYYYIDLSSYIWDNASWSEVQRITHVGMILAYWLPATIVTITTITTRIITAMNTATSKVTFPLHFESVTTYINKYYAHYDIKGTLELTSMQGIPHDGTLCMFTADTEWQLVDIVPRFNNGTRRFHLVNTVTDKRIVIGLNEALTEVIRNHTNKMIESL